MLNLRNLAAALLALSALAGCGDQTAAKPDASASPSAKSSSAPAAAATTKSSADSAAKKNDSGW